MFFIGILGIQEKQKPIGTKNNVICSACGALTRFEIVKSYSYFHVFFIPIIKWNVHYYLKSACCNRWFELDSAYGQTFEKGQNPDVPQESIHPLNNYIPDRICNSCGARVDNSYRFCPHCGKSLID